MAQFVGMLVEVTLLDQSSTVVVGRVTAVEGQALRLAHVFLPRLQQSMPMYDVQSSQIADLKILATDAQHVSSHGIEVARQAESASQDPAILSYNRPEEPQTSRYASSETVRRLQSSPVELSNSSINTPAITKTRAKPQVAEVQEALAAQGWRSTPLTENAQSSPRPHLTPTSQRPLSARKKKQRQKDKQIQEMEADQNGWASGDANLISDMPEFDFAANLSKFDKDTVFAQIRSEDTIATEDRLVSHNRLPQSRPGTYGGKNLHPTENVLQTVIPQHSGTQSDTQSDTETQPVPAISRKQSGHLSLPTRTLRSPNIGSDRTASPLPSVDEVAQSNTRLQHAEQHHTVTPDQNLCFRTTSTGLLCPVVDPARKRYSTTREADNSVFSIDATALAGRAIAQAIALHAARVPVPSRRNSRNHVLTSTNVNQSTRPVIVYVLGNHARAAQAVASISHLYGRGYKILVSLPPVTDDELDILLAKELGSIRQLGKKLARIGTWHDTSAQIKRLSSPPSIILDALLEGKPYGSLQDAATALQIRETIDWVNRSRATVISIECPSGYDATTAETTTLEGEPMAVIPDRVIALGTPVVGLLEAAKDAERWAEHITVVDIGIQPFNPNGFVPFGPTEWSVDLTCHPPPSLRNG